jgi:cell division control protein 6
LLRDHKYDAITGRTAERAAILSFLTTLVLSSSGRASSAAIFTSLYISGTPGTGKTALVRQILKDLPSTLADDDVFTVYINCMGLQEGVVWDRIVEEILDSGAESLMRGRCRTKTKGSKAAFEKLLSHGDAKWHVFRIFRGDFVS